MGTNAIGTALAIDHAVQVFSAEHFSAKQHTWWCSAAPIHDPATGAVLGVVDLSGPDAHGAPAHAGAGQRGRRHGGGAAALAPRAGRRAAAPGLPGAARWPTAGRRWRWWRPTGACCRPTTSAWPTAVAAIPDGGGPGGAGRRRRWRWPSRSAARGLRALGRRRARRPAPRPAAAPGAAGRAARGAARRADPPVAEPAPGRPAVRAGAASRGADGRAAGGAGVRARAARRSRSAPRCRACAGCCRG